jgi:hypothetical protein
MKLTEMMIDALDLGEDADQAVNALVKKNDALDAAMGKEHDANGSSPKFYKLRVQTYKNSIAIAQLHVKSSQEDLAAAKKKKADKSTIWKLEGQVEYHQKRIKKLHDDLPHWVEKAKGKPAKKSESKVNEDEGEVDRNDVKVGEVVTTKGDKWGDGSLLILSKSSSGFYCVPLKDGKIPSDPRVASSNSYLSVKFLRTSEKFKGKVIKFKKYSWFETGNKKVDTQMSQLGDMYKVFSEEATPEMQSIFDKLEDNNYHTENSQFVHDVVMNIIAKKDSSKIVAKYKDIADEL